MSKPDILIFMSDQHNGALSRVLSKNKTSIVDTPNLDDIAQKGINFTSAYSPCPVCVPARTAFLTGKLPSKTGVFTNFNSFSEDQATFLHSLGIAGYETVLCGRMHFVGKNQRHGFHNRIIGDILPSTLAWNSSKWRIEEQGDYAGKYSLPGSLTLAGGGNSPILDYDRKVIQAALDYLREDHDKPQLLVVGIYSPHFSYVAPDELFQKYLSRLSTTKSYEYKEGEYSINSFYKRRQTSVTQDQLKQIRAAYYGMIENVDAQIGQVREAFDNYTQRLNHKKLFIYTSDHGDTIGDRKIFAKSTFYEGSVKVPFFVEGSDINEGVEDKTPISLLDICPTLCEIVDTVPPCQIDGESITDNLHTTKKNSEKYIISEFMENDRKGQNVIGRMVRKNDYKLIKYMDYDHEDLLFDIENDPYETRNLVDTHTEDYIELSDLLYKNFDKDNCVQNFINRKHDLSLIREYSVDLDFDFLNDPDYVSVEKELKTIKKNSNIKIYK